jgi:hypothetical protein
LCVSDKISPLSSLPKIKPNKKSTGTAEISWSPAFSGLLLVLIFGLEVAGDMFLRNYSFYLNYTVRGGL